MDFREEIPLDDSILADCGLLVNAASDGGVAKSRDSFLDIMIYILTIKQAVTIDSI